MNKFLSIIFSAVALDAIGIGLIFPILPSLLKDVMQTSNVAIMMGTMAAIYAAMQFIFSPVLGALSDRFGRRPVLLLSLAGAAFSYVLLAFSSSFTLLMIGRAIAGLTSANMAVAMAYVSDISEPEKRTKRFGLLYSMFGLGFVIGPVLGGFLGDYNVHLPFIIAAILNAGNFLLALLLLPESHQTSSNGIDLKELNPLRSLVWALSSNKILPLVFTFFIFSATGEAYAVCWALWGHDSFQWNAFWVGLSLGTFGICQTMVQAFLPGIAATMLGERGAVFIGIGCATTALVGMAFANQAWMVFALMPIFALGSIGTPSLQALVTRQVDSDHQGRLQGVLAATVSLASIIAPLFFSGVYFVYQKEWPGAIWLSVVVLYLIAIPLVLLSTRARSAQIELS